MILVRKQYFSAISFSKFIFFRPLLAIETDFLFGLVAISLLLFDMFCPFKSIFHLISFFLSFLATFSFFSLLEASANLSVSIYVYRYVYTPNNRLWWKRAVNIISKTIQRCSQLRTLSLILFCSRYLPCSVL
jgi:hypothetical protein